MRDVKRIPQILERLQKIWEKHPELRLGQLIKNVFPDRYPDLIYLIEDEQFIEKIEQFYEKIKVDKK